MCLRAQQAPLSGTLHPALPLTSYGTWGNYCFSFLVCKVGWGYLSQKWTSEVIYRKHSGQCLARRALDDSWRWHTMSSLGVQADDSQVETSGPEPFRAALQNTALPSHGLPSAVWGRSCLVGPFPALPPAAVLEAAAVPPGQHPQKTPAAPEPPGNHECKFSLPSSQTYYVVHIRTDWRAGRTRTAGLPPEFLMRKLLKSWVPDALFSTQNIFEIIKCVEQPVNKEFACS